VESRNRGWIVLAAALVACADPADDGDEASSVSDTDSDSESDSDGEELELVRSDVPRDLAPDPAEEDRIADREGALGFTSSMFGEVGVGEQANVVFSPHSIRTAFAQVHLGSTGTVKTEIETVLGFAGESTHPVLNATDLELVSRNFAGETDGESERPPVELAIANSLFSDRPFADAVNREFLDAIALHYDAGIRIVPFDTDLELARTQVNGWVADQTRDRIPELIKFFPPAVELVVINAMYFKASWQTPFEPTNTTKAPFHTRAGVDVEVDTMHAYLLPADYAEAADAWQAVALPYSDPQLQMVVVLPEDHAAFEATLDGAALSGIFDALTPSIIDLSLPKFQVRSPFSLKGPLQALGMTAAFDDPAGFSGIPTSYPIWDVIHETFIAVDEKGTEAAAATAIIFGEDGGEDPMTEHVVNVDRTFYLAIRDRGTGTVLFFGRIGDPSQRSE